TIEKGHPSCGMIALPTSNKPSGGVPHESNYRGVHRESQEGIDVFFRRFAIFGGDGSLHYDKAEEVGTGPDGRVCRRSGPGAVRRPCAPRLDKKALPLYNIYIPDLLKQSFRRRSAYHHLNKYRHRHYLDLSRRQVVRTHAVFIAFFFFRKAFMPGI
ncbi:MAG: hypothetical protein IJM50_03220, partial [Lachnospiraceae bacterium]|nr:hypothetical protein [Lachnospiraceae bacterium]